MTLNLITEVLSGTSICMTASFVCVTRTERFYERALRTDVLSREVLATRRPPRKRSRVLSAGQTAFCCPEAEKPEAETKAIFDFTLETAFRQHSALRVRVLVT